jgi:hypothetical protein
LLLLTHRLLLLLPLLLLEETALLVLLVYPQIALVLCFHKLKRCRRLATGVGNRRMRLVDGDLLRLLVLQVLLGLVIPATG